MDGNYLMKLILAKYTSWVDEYLEFAGETGHMTSQKEKYQKV